LFLIVLMLASGARAADIRVQLFTAATPTEIEIIPTQAKLRTCVACKARAIDKPVKVVATAQVIHIDGMRAPVALIEGRYRIRAYGATTMELDAPLEIRSMRNQLRMVARMPLEEYVAMAVGAEAGGIKSPEALKAIAVAIRTYAVKFRGRHASDGFDMCDSTHCQALRLADTSAPWRAAAEDTEGELLWYEGEPAFAYHHASCGGMLEDGRVMLGRAVPYLRQKEDAVCAGAGSQWDAQIERTELRRALTAAGFRLGPQDGVAVTDRDNSGRARRVVIDGAAIDATSFRMAVGRELGWNKVRSELYEVKDEGASVLFRGRGRGHGVGLCQTGAQLRGEHGAGYREILSFYYPGTTLGVTAQGLRWMRMAGERVELMTTREQDKTVIAAAERVLHDAERRTGWKLEGKPRVQVYPTVAAFRDSTGEPGWVAASTIGGVVRLQPLSMLKRTESLDATLRHELLHMMVEGRAREGVPLWFREGVVLYLSGDRSRGRANLVDLEEQFQHPKSEQALKEAYAAASATVTDLVKSHGEEKVLRWVKDGVPSQR
jgi:stage II sporulation protein D